MAALFKRKDQTTIAELEEYYANQKSNKNGMAWMMALLSLLITLTVLVVLFFGGRWLYRTLTDDNESVVTTSGQNEGGVPSFGEIRTEESADSTTSDDSDKTKDVASNVNDANVDATSSNGGVVSDEAATTTTSNSPDVAGSNTDARTTTPATSPTTLGSDTVTEVPNTGAGEILLLAPLLATVAGYLFARNRQLNK